MYLLDPDLVALDAITGAERFRAPQVRGAELERAGRFLVAKGDAVPRAGDLRERRARAGLTWVDPSNPAQPAVCFVTPPAPPAADELEVFPFDRAGALYLFWHSGLRTPHGGTPPPPEREDARRAADGCGVLAFDVASCSGRAAEVPGYDRSRCSSNSPTIVIPAIAASAAPPYRGDDPTLRVEVMRGPRTSCEQHTTRELRATRGERVLWSRKLTDVVEICGPP